MSNRKQKIKIEKTHKLGNCIWSYTRFIVENTIIQH